MARRRVTNTRKDSQRDITALCHPGMEWSPRGKADAIRDIENDLHEYFVRDNYGNESDIHVVNGPTGKYLRTDHDSSGRNNLDNLPDC